MSLRLHGDTIARPGMLDFATCLWPSPPPRWLRAALDEGLDRYPDEGAARAAIAARHGRSPDEVLLLNGACEAFWLIAHALRPRIAACVHPSFTEPEAALRAAGTEVVRVPLDVQGWQLDPALVPATAEVVVVGSPNNPTGTVARADLLARDGRMLIVDESFIDFVDGGSGSLATRTDLPGLVVVRSLTKLYALAGVRAGYLLADPDLVERLAGQRQPWSVNTLACRALAACAGDVETPRRIAADVSAARANLVAGLERFDGLRVWPSVANFLLLRSDEDLVDRLAGRGIAVRPAASFPGLDESYVRIAVRPPADNAALIEALS